MKKLVLAFAFIFGLVSTSSAQMVPVLDMFHGAECPHCHAQMAWLPTLEAMYPDLQINKYEVWHNEENKQLAIDTLAELGETFGSVPTNVIDGDVIVGFSPELLISTMEKKYGPPVVPFEEVVVAEAEEEKGKKILFFVIVGLILAGSGVIFYRKA